MQYVVAAGRNAWHSKEEKIYKEGERIDVSHLKPEQIEALVKDGLLVAVNEEKQKEKQNG